MRNKTLQDLDDLSRDRLIDYIEELHDRVDHAQRELADSVREELDLKFSYDALRKRYNCALQEFMVVLVDTFNVTANSARQITNEIDKQAASEAATSPIGGCSG